MKKLGLVLFLILIIAIIFSIFQKWIKKQVSTLAQRLMIVEQEIALAMEKLQLTEELKSQLDKRVKLIFIGLKMVCCLLLGMLWILLFENGGNVLNSILDTFDVVGLGYVLVSLLVFNRLTHTNQVISLIGKRIRVWVYRTARFDPSQICQTQSIIAQKTEEAKTLRAQLGRE